MAYLSLFFHAIILLLLLCPVTTTLAQNHTADHFALMAIKSTITHDPQHVLDSWNTSIRFCLWQGVTCGRRHARVTKLDLRSRGMSGSLSPQIGNLSFLRKINLDNNTFKGVIPPQVGGLFRLQILVLSNNSFEGEVPASLSNCTRLKALNLAHNNLFGKLPQQLGSLVNLFLISIHNNGFTGGIPSFLANLTSLEFISAAYNNLGGSIPNALGQLHNLKEFGFGKCQLHGMIPSSLYNLTSVEIFSFTDNQIGGDLPEDIGLQLPNLVSFQLARNKFTGTIPFSFSNCSKLAVLSLSRNDFTGKINIDFSNMQYLRRLGLFINNLGSSQLDDMNFINSMTNCSKLEELAVHENQLRGVLPSSVGNLSSQLRVLAFADNFIYGSLPSRIGNFVNLETLYMRGNLFTGVIPSELSNLSKLQILYLGNNNFTGNIPDFIGNMSLLFDLNLAGNRLDGQIPQNLGKCKRLSSLELSENNLTGAIPRELFQLSALSLALNLSRNHLVGLVPREIGNLKSLTLLDLSQNDLVGAIPDAIGSCTSLEYLYLEANSFQGSIPLTISALRGIRTINISSNEFSGQIPRFLEQLNLSSLDLSFNNFSGKVPMGGIFKNSTAIKIDGNGRLCGGIPELGLPKCAMSTERLRKSSHMSRVILVVILLCSLLVVAMVFSLLFYLRRRQRHTQPTEASLMHPFSRVSYGSILKATNGFSEQNLIGMGGFGVVYKGILERDVEMVAIKVLKLGNQGALRSFMAECEALKNIKHRNLVKIITVCSSVDFQGNDFKALIYEYMPNGSLERWLHPCSDQETDTKEAPHRLNFRQRLSIATDVAHAIHYLHQESEVPIVHCDLKPSNILLDSDMVAHISDFGMAKLLRLKPVEISSTGVGGTIGYAAPEYGLGSEMTKEGDIYSFGILLLEMMIGKRPTDRMFHEGLNLHDYVKMAMPNRFMAITEPLLWQALEEETKLEDCMISLGRIGLACSMESAKERMDTSKIIHELHRINDILK